MVVLPFEGEKAEKFHTAVVKLVKKSHTVISAEKWESAAEELSAAKFNEKNIKKVAKKLKIDGVIEGKIDKRRDEYIIKIKLFSGASGTVAGSVSTKAEGPRLDGSASKDVKDELITAIGDLDSVRGGGGDDEEEEPKVKKKKGDDEEEEPKAVTKKKKGDDEEEEPKTKKKKKGDDEEEEPKKATFGSGKMKKGDDEEEPKTKKKKGDDEEKVAKKGDDKKKKKGDDEEKVAKKGDDEEKKKKGDDEENPVEGKKRPKKGDGDGEKDVAAKGDGEGDAEVEASAGEVGGREKMDKSLARSPGRRAVDATLGVSFNARRLSWKHDADLAAGAGAGQGRPPAYKGLPAPGAIIDISAYPLAFGHKSDAITTNIGLNILYDRALLISSKDIDGTKLATASQRIGIGALFRYPFGKGANAPVVGARLRYGKQLFEIGGNADIPNVDYSMIEPGLFVRYPINDKIIANLNASYMKLIKVGDIDSNAAYGKGAASGFDVELGGDYSLGGALFARATLRFETISHKFNGLGMLSTGRDADMEVDVQGAKDTYIGAAFTVGYLY